MCVKELSCSQAVEDLNRQTGAQLDPNDDLSSNGAGSSARGLMAAVSSLPELTERKRTIDKHMNLMTHLLKARFLKLSCLLIACSKTLLTSVNSSSVCMLSYCL